MATSKNTAANEAAGRVTGRPVAWPADAPVYFGATLFAREDHVEEAWRIVDPPPAADTPVHLYQPGTWGPGEVETVSPPGGWHDPRAE